MARTKSLSDIDAQIEKLRQKRRAIEEQKAVELGKLCSKSGLADLDVSEEELLSALKELTARFQNKAPEPARPALREVASTPEA